MAVLIVEQEERMRTSAHRQLVESEERYRDLVESSPDLICTHDLEGRLLSVNEAAVRMSGFSRAALLKMNMADLLTNGAREQFPAYLEQIRVRGRAEGLMRVRTASQGSRWLEYHGTLRADGKTAPIVRAMSRDVTDQRKAEEALKRSVAWFRTLADSTSVGIFIFQGVRFVYGNRANERLTGYRPEDFRDKRFWDIVHPADQEVVRQRGLARQRGEAVGEGSEFRIVRKDGAVRWIHFTAGEIEWQGKPAVLGTIADVTARRQAEDALRQSEARFRALTEMSSDFYWESDVEHRLTRRGSADKSQSGVSTFRDGAQIGQRRWEVPYLSPDEAGWQAHQAVLDAHQPFRDFELSRLGIDGSERFISISGDPVFDASGAFQGYRGVGTDITERKRAQAELQRLALAIRQSGSSILITDPAGNIEYVNPRFEAVTGYTAAEVLGRDPRILKSGVQSPAFYRNLRQTINAGREWVGELVNRKKCGELYWERMRISPVLDERGRIAHFVAVKEDITERKNAEERIKRLNRTYAVLSAINALIVRVRDRDELLQNACTIAVESGGFSAAWAGLVDAKTGEVFPQTHAGVPLGKLGEMPRSARADLPEGGGVMGLALRKKTPQVVNDTATDGRVIYRKHLLESGFRSLVALPLLEGGEAVGVISLLSSEVGTFDEEEMKLLRELAGDISFALQTLANSERLDYLAYYDPVTGVANRTLFHERLNQFLTSPSRGRGKMALALANIERLEVINDSLGRRVGDALLKEFAARLTANLGPTQVARISPDQFALILLEVNGRNDAGRKLAEICRGATDRPYTFDGTEIRISARCGIALHPNDAASAEDLLRNAEAALRSAMETSEHQVFYTRDLTAETAETLTLETKLRRALEREEFVLHYQPKLDLTTSRIVGVEALIRWSSPELGLVPPGKFIPLMEDTGLIVAVGSWALRQAVADHQRWQTLGVPAVPRIAVNVSPLQLRRRDFIDGLRRALGGVGPVGIDLEITESMLMRDIEDNIEKLKQACDLGTSVAIDDFGTGYSSLAYLAKLPVHALKIDRSFILSMLDDPNTMTLVSTIISLAHSLRLKVIAEGVETQDQAKFLRLLRCDQIQGYIVARPMPFDDLTALLARRAQPLAA